MTRVVHERLPIHFLFRHAEGGDVHGACGAQKDTVANFAAFEGGDPAVDGRLRAMDLGIDEKIRRKACQNRPCDESLNEVRGGGSFAQEAEHRVTRPKSWKRRTLILSDADPFPHDLGGHGRSSSSLRY